MQKPGAQSRCSPSWKAGDLLRSRSGCPPAGQTGPGWGADLTRWAAPDEETSAVGLAEVRKRDSLPRSVGDRRGVGVHYLLGFRWTGNPVVVKSSMARGATVPFAEARVSQIRVAAAGDTRWWLCRRTQSIVRYRRSVSAPRDAFDRGSPAACRVGPRSAARSTPQGNGVRLPIRFAVSWARPGGRAHPGVRDDEPPAAWPRDRQQPSATGTWQCLTR